MVLQLHETFVTYAVETPKVSANFVALAPDTAKQRYLVDFAHTQNIAAQSNFKSTSICQLCRFGGVACHGSDGAWQIAP